MTDILCCDALRLGYGGAEIVPALDLTLPPGRFTVLAGPNGSGKSTLLRGLAGALRPLSGRVTLNGTALQQLPLRRLARQIGLLPQDPQAPEEMSVEDLVRMGRHPHRGLFSRWSAADTRAVHEALHLTGLPDLAGRRISSLSGGQRQRAWIAMVLAGQAQVLLLDEPTSFLDLPHQIEVLSLIGDLVRAGRTVVAVLHDLNQAAAHADHLILLQSGRIAAAGPPETVLTPDIIAKVFGVEITILTDPETGRRICLPRRRISAATP